MSQILPDVADYYDYEVSKMIAENFGMKPMDALRAFVTSKTHALLANEKYGLTAFGAGGIYDMWLAEKVTGNPRNSIYVRGE